MATRFVAVSSLREGDAVIHHVKPQGAGFPEHRGHDRVRARGDEEAVIALASAVLKDEPMRFRLDGNDLPLPHEGRGHPVEKIVGHHSDILRSHLPEKHIGKRHW